MSTNNSTGEAVAQMPNQKQWCVVWQGWHRAIERSLGYVHRTIFKFIDFLRREQSAAEKKLNSLRAGKEFDLKRYLIECF